MDIEKHREEGNWRRCLELAKQSNSEYHELQNFLTGEAKLEIFLEEVTKKYPFASINKDLQEADKTGLEEAKDYLRKCLEGQNNSPLSMDANLLLAKAYYISGDYYNALSYIQQSGIEPIDKIDKNLPLRVIKLIAESLAIRGMALEKISFAKRKLNYLQHSFDIVDESSPGQYSSKANTFNANKSEAELYKAQVDCMTKAVNLSMTYATSIEKQKGPYMPIALGHILDSALLRTHHFYEKNGHLSEAIEYCRRMLNYCETSSILHIRQFLAKELAELLLKGTCRSLWKKPELGSCSKSGSFAPNYFGASLFCPMEYEEEILLLLMYSEAIASRNVILERSVDYKQARKLSLNNVMLIQDLFTLTLIPVQCYYIDNFERAMKYSFEVKHIWYQFALTLMQVKRFSLRSVLCLKEVSRMDTIDPIPNLVAAKICMIETNDYDEAVRLIQDSLTRFTEYLKGKAGKRGFYYPNGNKSSIINIHEVYGESNLLHQLHLMMGIAHALAHEYQAVVGNKRDAKAIDHMKASIEHLNKSIEFDIFGNDFLPYFHIALYLAQQRAIKQAMKYVRIALMLNSYHLPSIQLLILCLSALKRYGEALEVCKMALREFPSHLVLLYIRAHLEEVVCENGKELALLTSREILRTWKLMNTADYGKAHHKAAYGVFSSPSNLDTMSLRMEQTLSEVISLESTQPGLAPPPLPGGLVEASSMAGLATLGGNSRVLSHASSLAGSNSQLQFSESKHSFSFEMQIWILIIELFLRLDMVSQAESCINDGAVGVFGQLSHQLMYIKGMINKKQGRLLEAKIDFQNAISINPKHAKALQQLGHVFYLLKNMVSADKYLKDSLNVDSTNHVSWSYMGLVLDQMAQHEKATECHLTSLNLEETSPILPFTLIPRLVWE